MLISGVSFRSVGLGVEGDGGGHEEKGSMSWKSKSGSSPALIGKSKPGLSPRTGGSMSARSDVVIVIPGDDPPQIQGSPHLDRLRRYGEVRLHTDRPATADE